MLLRVRTHDYVPINAVEYVQDHRQVIDESLPATRRRPLLTVWTLEKSFEIDDWELAEEVVRQLGLPAMKREHMEAAI